MNDFSRGTSDDSARHPSGDDRLDTSSSSGEARAHERHDVRMQMALIVSLHGLDPRMHGFEASGTSVNLSRGGVLTRVRRPIVTGSRCLLRLPALQAGGHDAVSSSVYGTVRRIVEQPYGFDVAVEFDEPLGELEP